MASAVDIYNLALAHLGNKAQVTSANDGSVESSHCARFYPIALAEVLEAADWTFARKRVALSLLTTNPSDLWAYAYSLPSDCIVPRRIVTGDQTLYEQDSSNFELEGDYILTNQESAVLMYTASVVNTARFSPAFVGALSLWLAAYLSGPILKGESGTASAKAFWAAARDRIKSAMAADANRGGSAIDFVPTMVAARDGGVPSIGGSNPITYPTSGFNVS